MAPIISNNDDIAAHDRQEARVVGRYVQIDVRMAQRPPARYDGHVAIELEDGTRVLLYPVWHEHARRPADEIARFEGQRVEATGKLYARAPENREGSANLRMPCLKDITAIRLADDTQP